MKQQRNTEARTGPRHIAEKSQAVTRNATAVVAKDSPCALRAGDSPAGPYLIGQSYIIPLVRGRWHWITRNWPIFTPLHEDSKFLNFPHQHYHIDHRFVPAPVMRYVMRIWEHKSPNYYKSGYSPFTISPLMQNLGEIKYRRAQCLREWPTFPYAKSKLFNDLQNNYANAKLKDGHICPHKGVDLSTFAPDADGCVTCPAHGLRWNMSTGKLA